MRPAWLLAAFLLLATCSFFCFRLINGRSEILIVNASKQDLSSLAVSLADRTCLLGTLATDMSSRCVGRALSDGEIVITASSRDGMLTIRTGKYVNPNFGWSGLIVIAAADPPSVVLTSTDEVRQSEAK